MSHDNQNSQSWFGDVTNSFCAKCELWISSKHVHGLLSSISFCANWNVHSLESLAGNMWKQKNNPTGKLVETVEVLDMTPPVSTLWDVLPLLRRFPKTKKRISWVVISIEYKKTLHIYIYGYFSKNWMSPIFTKHSSFAPFIHPLLRIRTMAHCCRNLAATIGISKTNCRTKGSKSGDLGKMVYDVYKWYIYMLFYMLSILKPVK